MIEAPDSPYLVPFDDSFTIDRADTAPPRGAPSKRKNKKRLEELVEQLAELQRVLYADDRHALLLVFQAMDAAGKDGTIRAVFSGVNPAGFQVSSFKQPSAEELDHDFLWRCARRLPERGRIGVFNRSYYEETLVVRVHPEYLGSQRLPELRATAARPEDAALDPAFWEHRFESIRSHERHLVRNGTMVLKFWLNVSREEQRQRFLSRIDEPEKQWKFSSGDVRERGHWDRYMAAYESALNATSRPDAPWYAIPADDKPYMRVCVAEIIVQALQSLDLNYPEVSAKKLDELQEMRDVLERD